MSLHKSAWLVLSVILLTGGVAQSQTNKKTTQEATAILPAKKMRVVDGWRSAKFGMTENQVERAILKDFKVPAKRLLREEHPTEKTIHLTIYLKDLIHNGGFTRVSYVLGYKSKRLTKVELLWGNGVQNKDIKIDSKLVLAASLLLGKYFKKQGYQKEGYVDNVKLKDGEIIQNRRQDDKGRMILLRLHSFDPKKPKKTDKNIALILSYVKNINKRDIFRN